jgi:hypothetical protein
MAASNFPFHPSQSRLDFWKKSRCNIGLSPTEWAICLRPKESCSFLLFLIAQREKALTENRHGLKFYQVNKLTGLVWQKHDFGNQRKDRA